MRTVSVPLIGRHLIRQEERQDEDQRDKQDHLAQQRQKDKNHGVSQGDEGLLTGNLRAEQQAHRQVSAVLLQRDIETHREDALDMRLTVFVLADENSSYDSR